MSGMEIMAIASIASAVMGAKAQADQGRAAQAAANQQAQARMYQARVEAVNERMAGVNALRRGRSLMAAIQAGAGAAGIAAPPGGMMTLTEAAMQRDALSAETNAQLALSFGGYEASALRLSGEVAKRAAQFKAAGTLITAGGQIAKTGVHEKWWP